MKSKKAPSQIEQLAEDLECKIIREWGILLSGEGLARCLGYRSVGTMRQAIKYRTVPVPLFPIKNRRGKYALAKDVARWVAEQRASIWLSNPNQRPTKRISSTG